MDKEKIKYFYSQEIEKNRLESEGFKLEGIRTKEIIGRYLQKQNLEILDAGGGAGYYSFWLQEQGHDVSLVDLSPKNIELAKQFSEDNGVVLNTIETGEATNLNFPDNLFDIVLMMGPLYHLTERKERVLALKEALRALKPNGILIAAVISRYASMIDGFSRDLVLDDEFFNLMKDDLQTGIHLNETNNLDYFTTAYFHTPKEIAEEIAESGLMFDKLIAVESLGWSVKNFNDKSSDPSYMQKLLEVIRAVESNDDLIAMSPHIIAVARKTEILTVIT